MIEISNVKKIYKNFPKKLILNDVNFTINKGEFLSLMGKSGSGKTTLLNLIGGVDKPTHGSIKIDGVEITALGDDEVTIFRRENIGYIFQDFHLLPMLNVYENITLPIGLSGKSLKSCDKFVEEVMDYFELSSNKFSMVNELSGGQRQRVAIARALCTRPKIMLADEPTGNLDIETGKKILQLFQNINKEFGQTILMVTHDLDAAEYSQKIIKMQDGKIIGGGNE